MNQMPAGGELLSHPKSILIVRLSAIGDIIHALPVLDVLRDQLPDARIGWIAEEAGASLLEDHPAIDRIYVVPKKKWRGRYHKVFFSEIRPFFRQIRDDGWDAALDIQGISKSGLAAYMSGARLRVGFGGQNSREINGIFLNRKVVPRATDNHVVEQNVRTLEGFGLRVPDVIPIGKIPLTEELKVSIQERLKEAGWNGERLLAVNAGGGFPSKLWPPKYYAELAEHIHREHGLRPLVLWGPGEEAMRDDILAGLEGTGAIAAPPTNLKELAALISCCTLLISGDTGPSQMAGPLGVPVLTVFGSTTAERNRPWDGGSGKSFTVQRDDLGCIPCWNRRCPLKGDDFMACLYGLSADSVFDRAAEWLRSVLE